MRRSFVVLVVLGSIRSAASAAAQAESFVMVLGRDTVQLERFERTGPRLSGVIALRSPAARLLHFTMEVGPTGRLVEYRQWSTGADGGTLSPDPAASTMVFRGDSAIVEAIRAGEPVVARFAVPGGAVPFGTIPLGSSFAVLELGLAAERLLPMAATPTLRRLSVTGRVGPTRTPLHLARPDSVEVDYFGQGRFGVAFDPAGRLVRSDWRATTYQVLVTRVGPVDVEGFARRWADEEAGGRGFGRLSPRDTARAAVGDGSVEIDYSRPAARGRRIWGGVVPWGTVWRLGADMATHLVTTTPIQVGGAGLEAGTYTLWMLPSEATPLLIINRRTRVFGTQYDAAADLARVPLAQATTDAVTERLTIEVRNGALEIRWADRVFSAPLAPGAP